MKYTEQELSNLSIEELKRELSECKNGAKIALDRYKKTRSERVKLYNMSMAELFMMCGKACEKELINRSAL